MAEVFQKGTLYLCATPIGNLEDITYRTVRCLTEADIIAAEDTRHTRQLLSAYGIERLQDGDMVAVVSDAGLPGICDPGSDLVREALAASIPVVPLPGANAGLTGLIASGLDTTLFTFVGFLPKTKRHRRPVLEGLKEYGGTLIFYEAPHRIEGVLAEIEEVLGDRPAVLCRELTKKYEEYIRGSLSCVRQRLQEQGCRGEFVVLIGADAKEMGELRADLDYESVLRQLLAEGTDKKDAIRITAERCRVPKREVYKAALRL